MHFGKTLKIIGGEFKGKKLYSIKGIKIRPTAAKLRESIFNIIGPKVKKKSVLDLFSGTGALGLESLSRGAEFCIFIDNNKSALDAINKNVKICGVEKKSKLIKSNIIRSLSCIAGKNYIFNLVFMDPPYYMDVVLSVLKNLSLSKVLEDNAIVVVEHSVSKKVYENIPEFNLYDHRKYGKSFVSFLKHTT
mmetsp:Transcript_22494/g.10858  ORF Transcript_22494/g.10858 Transcript_22494/m.10858 type:complete len:191 (-) Transcript_22494:1040-1612(-)